MYAIYKMYSSIVQNANVELKRRYHTVIYQNSDLNRNVYKLINKINKYRTNKT